MELIVRIKHNSVGKILLTNNNILNPNFDEYNFHTIKYNKIIDYDYNTEYN